MLNTQHAKEVKQYLRDPMISCLAWPCRVSLPQISRRHVGLGMQAFQPHFTQKALSRFSQIAVFPSGSPWHPGCLWCCAGAEEGSQVAGCQTNLFPNKLCEVGRGRGGEPFATTCGQGGEWFSFPKLATLSFFPLAPFINLRCTEY